MHAHCSRRVTECVYLVTLCGDAGHRKEALSKLPSLTAHRLGGMDSDSFERETLPSTTQLVIGGKTNEIRTRLDESCAYLWFSS